MTSCKIWTKAVDGNGYGKIHRQGKFWKAHRYAWTLKFGKIPEGMLVLHKCDNPRCYNIAHLFLGTQSDNLKDAVAKGRWVRPSPQQRGELHSQARLTEKNVLEIRQRLTSGETHQSIADDFGVCREMVTRIHNRKAWTHI
jgi:Autographiviridae endonuclease